MQHDLHLVHAMLVHVARAGTRPVPATDVDTAHPDRVVRAHARLLARHGLLRERGMPAGAEGRVAHELTREGRDMLRALKDPRLWERLRARAAMWERNPDLDLLAEVAREVLLDMA